jgi:hypothetical protein
MNASKVRSEIEKVIAENRTNMTGKQVRKQFAPGKAQIAKLTELGILDLMPQGFGFSDADAVIRAATESKSAIMNAYGEGEEVPASALNQAVNQTEGAIKVGSEVKVNAFTQYSDLRGGAVHSEMHERQHHGYKKAVVEAIFTDGLTEVFVPGLGIDYVPLETLELL